MSRGSRRGTDELDEPPVRPVAAPPADRLDDDLVTIPKYVGKTNEQFTRLLLTLTTASSAAGLEIDGKDVEAYAAFLRTWLERKRLKHRASFAPVRRSGAQLGRRFVAEFARTKQALAAGDVQRVEVVHADTVRAGDFFRPASFDVVAADAPYGVQHGSRRETRSARSPIALLEQALPVWRSLLRPSGRSASPGTRSWPRGPTSSPCWPPPACSPSTRAPTATCSTASTKASSATS